MHLFVISPADLPAPSRIGKAKDLHAALSALQQGNPLHLKIRWSHAAANPSRALALAQKNLEPLLIRGLWFNTHHSHAAATLQQAILTASGYTGPYASPDAIARTEPTAHSPVLRALNAIGPTPDPKRNITLWHKHRQRLAAFLHTHEHIPLDQIAALTHTSPDIAARWIADPNILSHITT